MSEPDLLPSPPPAEAEPPEAGAPITPQSERTALLYSAVLLRLRTLWPWFLLIVIGLLGWEEVRKIDLLQVRGLLVGTDTRIVLGMLLLTGLNLAVAGLYDVSALGPLVRPPRAGPRWTVGVVTFAWSNFLTLGPLAGPALRLWLYKPLGVDRKRSRSALAAILVSFSLALVLWCAMAALPLPARLDNLPMRVLLGAFVAGAAALGLALVSRFPILPRAIRGWEADPLALGVVATTDWLLAWAVFHLAMSGLAQGVPAVVTLKLFFFGQLIGLASMIPGGLGSADAFWLFALNPVVGAHDRVLAALLLYRVVYYLLPWSLATLYLVGHLVRGGRRTRVFSRVALAFYSFLCGAVLLISAATPAVSERIAFLNRTVPLTVVELSHLLSAGLGFLLLVISRGLARGYQSSHRVALALFFAGGVTTFLKGLDFEEALMALLAVGLLLIFRDSFRHQGHLRPSAEFTISVSLFAIVLFAAVGFGSFAVPSLDVALSHFVGPLAQSSRFLRGFLLLLFVVAGVAFHLAQRARVRDPIPDPREVEEAVAISRRLARTTDPLLVAAGDKALFWMTPGRDGFIPYRTSGRFRIAYSDPVCPAGSERELLAQFLSQSAAEDRDVILYQISAAFLPVAHDFGFNFFKLGEAGCVDLARFDLKGNKAKKWRNAINRVERSGGRLEILRGEALDAALPELRRVSDAWLAEKPGAEKGFSVGRFDEAYLRQFPCAVVRDAAGEVRGFANILEGAPGGEISVDLMRYLPGGADDEELSDVIPYLFLELMIYGKERGYARFNLGMAPLAAVGEMRWARPFERLAHLFFRHGEHWFNFQGLRRFKEKFEPAWEPRYMAYPRPWDWPAAITSTAVLIAGGWSSVLSRRKST